MPGQQARVAALILPLTRSGPTFGPFWAFPLSGLPLHPAYLHRLHPTSDLPQREMPRERARPGSVNQSK